MQKSPAIEQSLQRLEEIVGQLGGENVSLDDSLALFAEGMKLSRQCMEQLDQAELVIEEHSVS